MTEPILNIANYLMKLLFTKLDMPLTYITLFKAVTKLLGSPNSDCTTDGDKCCDTPPHFRNFGCPCGTNSCDNNSENKLYVKIL